MRRVLAALVDEIERVIGDGVRRVKLSGWIRMHRSRREKSHHVRIPRIHRIARIKPVKPVETARGRKHVAHVPFARHERLVAGLFQNLGKGDATVVELSHVAGQLAVAAGHQSDAGLLGIEPGEQGGPGRTAARAVIKLREAQTTASQRIEIGRVDFAPVTAEIAEARVVRQNDENVGAGCRLFGPAGLSQEERQESAGDKERSAHGCTLRKADHGHK